MSYALGVIVPVSTQVGVLVYLLIYALEGEPLAYTPWRGHWLIRPGGTIGLYALEGPLAYTPWRGH